MRKYVKDVVFILCPLLLVYFGGLSCIVIRETKPSCHLVVATSPSGAEVYVDGMRYGTTPLDTYVERSTSAGGDFLLVIRKQGYREIRWTLAKSQMVFSQPVVLESIDSNTYAGSERDLTDQGSPSEDGKPLIATTDGNRTANSSSAGRQLAPLFGNSVLWRASKKARVVCVGISQYRDDAVQEVRHAANDAQAVSAFVRQAGVPEENVTVLTDEQATRSRIIEVLSQTRMATTEKSERAIFYFSGHGAPLIQDGKIHAGVIVPYDASVQDLENTCIKLDLIKEKIGDLPGSSIIILDACFSGKEGRSLTDKKLRAITVAPAPRIFVPEPKENSWWLSATSGDNFANDLPKESHGLFTYYLLRALSGEQGVDADEDGLITIKEAFVWTKDKVTSISAKSLGRLQVPELIGKGDTVLTIPTK